MQNEIIIDPTIDLINSISNSNKKIHIRIKQRNGKKSTTSVEQLPSEVKLVDVLKKMRQEFACNGSLVDTEFGKRIQLFGDQRLPAKKFLLENHIVENENNITMHGY